MPKNRLDNFKIWQKGSELADAIQKITDRVSSLGSCDIWSSLRKMTFSIPSYLAEGFMMKNIKDGKDHFYRALNCLEEVLKTLVLTEQMGYITKAQIRKIKQDIIDLNGKICELLRFQQGGLS
jgi:four helix bundle protein